MAMPFCHSVHFLTAFRSLCFPEYFDCVVLLTCPMVLHLSLYNIVSMNMQELIFTLSCDNNVGYHSYPFLLTQHMSCKLL